MSQSSQIFNRLSGIIRELRGTRGCPWDKQQTIPSMLHYLQAEQEELVAAVNVNDHQNICEELGDLLYILLLMAIIAEEDSLFTVDDVLQGISDKLIRRHPHVFQHPQELSLEELQQLWQSIKDDEKYKQKS